VEEHVSGVEEFGHVEMLAVMIGQLLEEGVEDVPVRATSHSRRRTRPCTTSTSTSPTARPPRPEAGRAVSLPDGKGEFAYLDGLESSVPVPPPTHPDARFYGTTELPNVVEKAAGAMQDKLHKE
jgi:Mn-containing catalase